MVQSKKICALLLLAALFVGTCESARWCYYYDLFGEIFIYRCPFVTSVSSRASPVALVAPGSSGSKDCTKENPCQYEGEKP